MRIAIVTLLLACLPFIHALTVPQLEPLSRPRDPLSSVVQRNPDVAEQRSAEPLAISGGLEKRRGGGGGGKGGGGSSGGKSGGGKSGGSGSSSGSSSPKSLGGGRFYGGGAVAPFSSGQRSPLGIVPFFLPVAALGIFSGLWLYSVYAYPYPHPIHFFNRTNINSTFPNGINQTLPVLCLCQQYSDCGCDDNVDQTYIADLLGNGSLAALNKTLAQVSNVNGTTTLVLNGTLSGKTQSASGTTRGIEESFGWWVLAAVLGWTVWMM